MCMRANLCREVHVIFVLFDEVPDHALRCALVAPMVFVFVWTYLIYIIIIYINIIDDIYIYIYFLCIGTSI